MECKTGERSTSPAIRYFSELTAIPRFFQVHLGAADHERQGVRVLPFFKLCELLDLI